MENFCELIKHTMIEMHQYLYQFMLNRKDSFAIVICLSSINVNTYHLNFEIHNYILILRTTVHLYQKFKYNSLNSWLKFALIEINICCPLLFLKCTRNIINDFQMWSLNGQNFVFVSESWACKLKIVGARPLDISASQAQF